MLSRNLKIFRFLTPHKEWPKFITVDLYLTDLGTTEIPTFTLSTSTSDNSHFTPQLMVEYTSSDWLLQGLQYKYRTVALQKKHKHWSNEREISRCVSSAVRSSSLEMHCCVSGNHLRRHYSWRSCMSPDGRLHSKTTNSYRFVSEPSACECVNYICSLMRHCQCWRVFIFRLIARQD